MDCTLAKCCHGIFITTTAYDGVQRIADGFAVDLDLPLTVGDGAELRGDLDGD